MPYNLKQLPAGSVEIGETERGGAVLKRVDKEEQCFRWLSRAEGALSTYRLGIDAYKSTFTLARSRAPKRRERRGVPRCSFHADSGLHFQATQSVSSPRQEVEEALTPVSCAFR